MKLATSMLLAAAGVFACAAVAGAGPLTPPAGPVAPTYRTLAEVEPRTPLVQPTAPATATAVLVINQPGSYYLVGNVTAVGARHGIHIQADNVTLDLSGLRLQGAAGSLSGIFVEDNRTGISIHDGVVTGWGQDGIGVTLSTSTAARNVRIERVSASNNGNVGIFAGRASVVMDCVADGNSTGIACISGSITRCSARLNTTRGIDMVGAGVISQCAATDNTGLGIGGGSGSVVQSCSATNNTGSGIQCSSNVTVIGCTVSSNVSLTFGALLLNGGCIARDNTVNSNQGHGIQATGSCLIVGNECSFNGTGAGDGAGILVTFTRNRIEGNQVIQNDRGIDVNSTSNLVIRNTAMGNTGAGAPFADYDIAANNDYGQIITLAGAGSLVSSDPNANFRRP